VDRRGYDECWPWTGAKALAKGMPDLYYGRFFWGGERRQFVLAHRAAFYFVHGHWPEPQALHGCDFGLCCNAENPEHVHEGTAAENTKEMHSRGRGHLPPVRVGIEAGRAKLTDDQARALIAVYQAGGVSQESLAALYGVSQASISYIVRGRRRSLQ